MTEIVDGLFALSMEAVLNPIPFAITLAFAAVVIVGTGFIATKLLERFE